MLNLDTHILLFALEGSLSPKEQRLLESNSWGISAIVLWEVTKLVQLKRVELDFEDSQTLRSLSRLHVWPITFDLCQTILKLDIKGDPADEMIAATSVLYKAPLVTRDEKLRRSKKIPLAH